MSSQHPVDPPGRAAPPLELRISEERLRLALDGTDTGTWEWRIGEDSIRWSENMGPLFGLPRGTSPGSYEEYQDLIHPDDRAGMAEAVRRAVEEGLDYRRENRSVWPDGTVRWHDARAHVVKGDDGRAEAIVGFTTDITERRRREDETRFLDEASHALAGSLEIEQILEGVARLAVPRLGDWCAVALDDGDDGAPRTVAVAHVDPEKVAYAEELQRRYPPDPDASTGVPEVIRTGVSELYTEIPPQLLEQGAQDEVHLRIIKELQLHSAVIVPMTARGRTVGAITLVHAESGRRYRTPDLPLIEELGRRAGLAVDNARLHAAERQARAAAEQATSRLGHLQAVAEAGLINLGLDDVLQELLRRVRDALGGDFATILLLDEERQVLTRRARLGHQLQSKEVDIPVGAGIAGRIAAEARPLVFPDVPAAGPYREDLRREAASLVGVPLKIGERVIGVVHVSTRAPRDFGPDDITLLELVADRAALAIEHAWLYDAQRSAAETLQRSLLPPGVPLFDGVRLAARYIAGRAGTETGGDWWDVLPLPSGLMAVTVGDVAGRGIEAAAQMGELRTVLRAYTLEDPAPGVALGRLNDYILEAGQATFATAVHVLFDPATGALRMASAGHLPVLRRNAAGVELLTPPTTPPLGAPWDAAEEQEIVLDEGDVILLFSDGLVERRHAPIDEQLERLVSAASAAPDDPEAFLDHVMDGMGADLAHGDDVVALVLRRQRAGAKA